MRSFLLASFLFVIFYCHRLGAAKMSEKREFLSEKPENVTAIDGNVHNGNQTKRSVNHILYLYNFRKQYYTGKGIFL